MQAEKKLEEESNKKNEGQNKDFCFMSPPKVEDIIKVTQQPLAPNLDLTELEPL
jgi:hypothetical protein